MSKPRLLLAAVNWLSLTTLIWLLILNLIPFGVVQTLSLVFFFLAAMAATVYEPIKKR